MAYRSFESLDVWKRGCRLAQSVYEALSGTREFTLRDQMTRAAVSIPSNIAEGYERGTERDFVRFLRIAQGSAAELRTQAYIASSIQLLDNDVGEHLIRECKEIGAMLQGLAKARSKNIKEPDTLDYYSEH